MVIEISGENDHAPDVHSAANDPVQDDFFAERQMLGGKPYGIDNEYIEDDIGDGHRGQVPVRNIMHSPHTGDWLQPSPRRTSPIHCTTKRIFKNDNKIVCALTQAYWPSGTKRLRSSNEIIHGTANLLGISLVIRSRRNGNVCNNRSRSSGPWAAAQASLSVQPPIFGPLGCRPGLALEKMTFLTTRKNEKLRSSQ